MRRFLSGWSNSIAQFFAAFAKRLVESNLDQHPAVDDSTAQGFRDDGSERGIVLVLPVVDGDLPRARDVRFEATLVSVCQFLSSWKRQVACKTSS